MKILFSAFLIFGFMSMANCQVIEYYLSIEKSNDTLADLHYFKNLDKSIRQKLDSFFLLINKRKKMERSDGVIEFSMFSNQGGKIIADVALSSQYSDYRIFSSKETNFGNIFAFSFYRSNLILFSLSSSQYRIKEENQPVLRDLLYAEFSEQIKKEIDANATEFQINVPGIVRRYYLTK